MLIFEIKKMINKDTVYSYLCYYDMRNPVGIMNDIQPDDPYIYQLKKGSECSCDNCFYGRTKLAEYTISLLKEREKNI